MVSVQAYPWNIRHKVVPKNTNFIHTSDCDFCKQHEEYILHLLVLCAVVKNFGDDVKLGSVISVV